MYYRNNEGHGTNRHHQGSNHEGGFRGGGGNGGDSGGRRAFRSAADRTEDMEYIDDSPPPHQITQQFSITVINSFGDNCSKTAFLSIKIMG